MIIINGKRHYAAEMRAMKELPFHGWDTSHDIRIQQYFVSWNRETGLTNIEAESLNDLWGEDFNLYFNSPAEFRQWVNERETHSWEASMGRFSTTRDFERLLGDVDEDNEDTMAFINAAYGT